MAIQPSSSLVWDTERLRFAIDASGVGFWSWNVDSDEITMDGHAFNIWGVPSVGLVTFEDLSAHIHPADRDRVRAAFAATRAIVGSYETDFRIMLGEEVRWISARGRGNDVGLIGRVVFGIFLDVTQRKQAEEARELLAGEMSHRVKNLLNIASALARTTSPSATTTTEVIRDLTHRLAALGRAHDLVRPDLGQQNKALLGDLLTVLLAPYEDTGAFHPRIRVSVPKLAIDETAAMTLALVIHELATNSLKYGSISVPSGTLDLSCTTLANEVTIVWTERGGPLVVAPTPPLGFGSKMVVRSMNHRLGGSVAFDWSEEGVIVTLRMKKDRLTA
ncbi:sensor histidine kinase [Falsiroseomonas sp. E2-1-a20]|uniref:sensor histidine kinase n=1 Tax=Falsiroseomonas sp. E2-1-a20 TaxID=3239300 RepID=UPI003F33D9E6